MKDTARVRIYLELRVATTDIDLEPPLIEFPPYTISREAIAALLDGYISAYDTPEDIKSTRRFLGNIEMCKKLLGRKDHGRAADQLFWNSVIFRSTQLLLLEPTAGLYALGGTLNLAHASFFDAGPTISDRSSQDTAVADFANSLASPTFGIMLWALHEYIVTRNVKNAVRVFRWLQKSRMRRLAQPNKPLTSDQASRGAYPDLDQGELSFIDESWHDIPWATVAAFLELLTAEKVYDVARSLIYLPSSDKICLSAKVLSSDIFQPALLQFATATRNLPLVTEVAKHFDIGRIKISEDLAQNLLSCNLMFRKWAFCSTLLNYMKDQSYWLRAEDIMLLALQVLLLDHETKSSGDLSEACNILTAILNSEYAPRPVPGSKVDYSPYRQINQIRRMLATIPGVLLNTACTSVVNTGPAHSITIIPTDAFNILLEGVVETLGAVQGKQVFDRWCDFSTAEGQDLVEFRETHHIEGEKFRGQRVTLRTEGYEKVVSPNVRTISIILSPALRSLDDFFERKKKPTSIPTKPVEEPAQQEKSLLSQSDAKEPLQLKWTDDTDIWYVHQGQAKEMQELCVLPYDAPSRDNLEWGIRSYRALGLNYKEISDLIPGAIAAPVESTTELETVDEPGLQSRKSRVRREALKGLVKI